MRDTFIIFAAGGINLILWLVIGWRAMRAHEKIADAISEHLRNK